ncbi:BglG family transcription antiterminator [Aerococcus urinaeequi]|uniref:BglG family transcription antiterminator n=1 Tax=Aerococcus urinaeequi TaxID=51665 RepID=UPI0022E494B7|nr:PTS sugar transporter subunit IIA [Aerococcus urinaeequi]
MKDRSIEILKKIDRSNLPLTFDYLSDEFDVTTRTIRNEIEVINEFLQENDLATVESIRGKGLSVNFSEVERDKINDLLHMRIDYYSKDERILDLVLSIALDKQPTYLYRKQEFYSVSKSTMDEDMRSIRAFLTDYNIEIISTPKVGMVLKGKERAIRTMIYSLINKNTYDLRYLNDSTTNLSHIVNGYIEPDIYCEIEKIFQRDIWNPIGENYRQNSMLLLSIWIKRLKQGFIVAHEEFDQNYDAVTSSKFYKYLNAMGEEFEIAISDEEQKYIIFVLESLISEDDEHRAENWMELQILTIQMINSVENNTRIPFSQNESVLHSGIYNHLKGMVLRLNNQIHLSNPLTITIKKTYADIFAAIKLFFENLENEHFIQITEDEIAYLTIHFSASLSVINQENQYWYRAAVICNHGVATGKLLAENLKELFNIEIIGVFSSVDIDVLKKLDIDLIFSTVDIVVDFRPFLKLEPIITDSVKGLINQFLMVNRDKRRLRVQEKDYTEMFQSILGIITDEQGVLTAANYEKLEEVFLKHGLHTNEKELQPMIKDILMNSDIQIQKEVANWEDAIRVVSLPLLEKGVIEESYIDAMIESVHEFGPYIVLAPQFALAHARPEDGANQVGLSILTLNEGVDFGNSEHDPVKLIFCLSAIDSHSHLKIMKEIINLINHPDKIDQISKATSIENLKTILLNEGES